MCEWWGKSVGLNLKVLQIITFILAFLKEATYRKRLIIKEDKTIVIVSPGSRTVRIKSGKVYVAAVSLPPRELVTVFPE